MPVAGGAGRDDHGTERRLGQQCYGGETPKQQADCYEGTRHQAALHRHHRPRTTGEIPRHQADDVQGLLV